MTATNGSGSASATFSGTVGLAPGDIEGAPGPWQIGQLADGSLSATGTPAPTFQVTEGELPAGIVLDPVTGAFAGSPITAGPYSFTVTADNGYGTPGQRTFEGVVNQAPAWVTTSEDGTPQVGVPFEAEFIAEGTPDPTYEVRGTLPDGLTLNAETGTISGTPTTAGPVEFTLVATSEAGEIELPLSWLVVESPGAIAGDLGDWQTGQPVSGQLTSTGTPSPAFTVTAGELPDGVALDPATGEFSGSPDAPGQYTFTVSADNGVGTASTREFTIDVTQAPVWSAPDPLVLEVGALFSAVFSAQGAPDPTYSVGEGELPDGLTLDAATGEISGEPTTPGPYAFTLVADNGVGTPALLPFTGIVLAAPAWTDVVLPAPRIGVSYSDTVRAEGTPAPAYSITGGALPAGLTLDEVSGAITGTPTRVGPYAFTVSADNGVGEPVSHAFEGLVEQPPTASTTPSLGELRAGGPVHVDLSVAGTPAPTYRVTAGELPAGLTLDPVTGLLSGTPTTPGPYSFTLTADNGVGEILEFVFSGEVLAETAGDAASGGEAGARAETAAGGLLPATGADLSALLLALAVGLVVLGSALAGRRRSSRLSSS